MKNFINQTFLNVLLILCLSQATSLLAQPALPLMQIGDLEYQGAFAIPAAIFNGVYGESGGIIAYNSANASIFLAGVPSNGTVGEFSIPALVNSTNLADLNVSTILQNPVPVLNRAPSGNAEGINVINGMAVINGQLVVNAENWYGTESDVYNTLTLNNPSNIANSVVNGYYSLKGAAHAAGWISPIPNAWQPFLGGSYITGHSSKYSIDGRYAMGITAFAFNPSNISGNIAATIPTNALLDFSLANPLYAQYNNYGNANYNLTEVNGDVYDDNFHSLTAAEIGAVSGSNDLWTVLSQASYGFIVPETNTYLTIGFSGGHNSGIGYKAIIDGAFCDGPCPYDFDDYVNYYWLWDVDDLLDVKNGIKNPYDVRPYDYGIFDAPFQENVSQAAAYQFHGIVGGTYDTDNGLLYLAIDYGGSVGPYDRIPAIAAYKVGSITQPPVASNFLTWETVPTSVSNGDNLFIVDYSIDQEGIVVVHLYDANYQNIGQVIENVTAGEGQPTLTLTADGVSADVNHIEAQLLNPSWGDIGVPLLYENVPGAITQPPMDGNFLSWSSVPTSVSNGDNLFSLDYSIDQNGIVVVQLYDSNYQFIGQAFENVTAGEGQSTLTLPADGVSADVNHIEAQLLNPSWADIGVQYLYENVPGAIIQPPMDNNFLSWGTVPTSVTNGDNLFSLDYSIDQDGIVVVQLYDANYQFIGQAVENVSAGSGQSNLTLTADGVSANINHIEAQLLSPSWGDIGVQYLYEKVPGAIIQPPMDNNFLSWGTVPTSVSNGDNLFSLDYSIDQDGIVVVQLYDSNYQFIGQAFENVTAGSGQSNLTLSADGVSADVNHIEAQLLNPNWGDIGVQYLYKNVPSGITQPPIVGECNCDVAAEPGNTITVSNVSQLENAINQANNQGGNMTIKVAPGIYQLNYGFVISPNMNRLTIMGTTGNRNDVTIKGLGWNNDAIPFIFKVQADEFTIAHLTLAESSTHLIQIQAELDADDFTAVNVRFIDAKEQLLKVSKIVGGPFSDNGRVLCCAFEFTAGVAYQNYTGGIDAHRSRNWVVKNSTFKNIRRPDNEPVVEHAIHFWQVCENITVVGNKIMNCDRGIGFGLGNSFAEGNTGGLIMNNFVHTYRGVGIGLEHSPGTKVYNNTVVTDNYPRSIEYRFPATTNVRITNNLVFGSVTSRDGGSATNPDNNYPVVDLSIFEDAGNYNYHIVGTPAGIVDAGTALSEVITDIDCDDRTASTGIDIGADEVSGSSSSTLNPTCPQQLTLNQAITTGLYKANTITIPMSTNGNTVTASGEISFQAKDSVSLESILIPKDSSLEINIRGCNE